MRWFLVSWWFARFIHHKATLIIGGAIVGTYASLVKLSWFSVISDNKHEHEFALSVILISGCLFGIHRGFREVIIDRENKDFVSLFSDICGFANNVVRVKRERFSSSLSKMKKKDIFRQITKPDVQINSISKGGAKLFCKAFDLQEEDLDITVICFNPYKGNGHYLFLLHDQVKHASPSTIKNNITSTGYDCLCTGEPRFWPSKASAHKQGKYSPSFRDTPQLNGSIYCHPFSVPVDESGAEFQFLINIVTYQKRLAKENDIQSTKAAMVLIKSVTTRLELELSLYAIKEWQDNTQPTQPQRRAG
jgi:hypothetical protein